MVIVGTIIYQITIYFAMNTGLMAIDLKMITSVVIIIFMAVSNMKKGEIKNGGGLKMLKIRNLSKSFITLMRAKTQC
jgi:putative ABC transport system permease protein